MDGVTGFLTPPGQPVVMAERIVQLLSDPDLRRRFGENAATDVSRRFDLRRQVDAYLRWYGQIVQVARSGLAPAA